MELFLLPAFILIISIIGLLDTRFLISQSFVPYKIYRQKDPTSFLTYWTLHNGTRHLITNLVALTALLVFARTQGVLCSYMVVFVLGCLLSVVVPCYRNRNKRKYVAVGASGGIYALVSFALWTYRLDFIPVFGFEIPVWTLITALAVKQLLFSKPRGTSANDIHGWGFLIGWLAALVA